MRLELALHAASALLSAGFALAVLWRDRRSFVHRAFAFGMAALAVEEALAGAAGLAPTALDRVFAERLRLFATALLPGAWLCFSLGFARSDHGVFLRQWRWVIVAAFALPLALALAPGRQVFAGGLLADGRWLLPLGPAGQAFHLAFLAAAVLILANLERTLRASTGSMRWFIKYVVLGVGGLFATRIYTSSQALLFRVMDTGLHVVESAALIVAAALIAVSLVRARLRDAQVYVSQSVLYGSVTGLLVGVYLVVVGVLARLLAHFGGVQSLPAVTFFVFLALIGLASLLLSDRLRQRLRGFVSRNFRRPHYDYRKEWTAFTRHTASLFEMKALCAAVAARVSQTLRVPSVTLWLRADGDGGLALGGSTVYSEAEAAAWAAAYGGALEALMRGRSGTQDLHALPLNPGAALPRAADTRYAIPLTAASGEELGLMVLGARREGPALSLEDKDLLQTLADQVAGNVLGLRLSEQLLKAKEMEAFQSLSAFFVHDLKNLASRLSLTLQNLPAHYDDPDFRRDLLATIGRSVAKIEQMCTRLSPLSRTLDLQRTATDLSEVVGAAVAGLNGSLRAHLEQDLRPTPPVSIDADQIQKVVLNLVLNANDAVRDGGQIRVVTGKSDRWVYLAVSDDGCGMSPDFMTRSLFRPFRTTKGQGLGIGLYHSRKIVEAHSGRIEVESEQGKGTTFRVMLPT